MTWVRSTTTKWHLQMGGGFVNGWVTACSRRVFTNTTHSLGWGRKGWRCKVCLRYLQGQLVVATLTGDKSLAARLRTSIGRENYDKHKL